MLSETELRDYTEWIGKPPEEIRQAAIRHGGWEKVFPTRSPFPLWASRVRNYFNETPSRLMLLGDEESNRARRHARLDRRSLITKGLKALLAFSGHVYRDEANRRWFQMVAVSTIYHYEGRSNLETLNKVGISDAEWYKIYRSGISGQRETPVFKLITPDGTGGSLELCVHNWQHYRGRSQIGSEGSWVNIKTHVVINEIYRGSYNYSETGLKGLSAHDFRDVKPHRAQYGFYVNPPTQSARRFPERDSKGREIRWSRLYIL